MSHGVLGQVVGTDWQKLWKQETEKGEENTSWSLDRNQSD